MYFTIFRQKFFFAWRLWNTWNLKLQRNCDIFFHLFSLSLSLSLYIYIYIYILYSFWAKVFDSIPYGKLAQVGFEPTNSSYLAKQWDVLNDLQDQVTMKLKSLLGDCSGRVWITFAANFLNFLYFHPHSELILG